MNDPQPTYKQAKAFLLAAYKLKERLSDDFKINIEVTSHGYDIVVFKRKGYKWDCVGCNPAYYSLFSEYPMLTDEQNHKAINHCIDEARDVIAKNGGFKTK